MRSRFPGHQVRRRFGPSMMLPLRRRCPAVGRPPHAAPRGADDGVRDDGTPDGAPGGTVVTRQSSP
ncbi:hypothetical protein QCN29_35925 [Streptomyces sp. HNM0663]|uniref:Uncharacterized protein n=1 Tax=Streptomyces chengmaiensis TaxID=3040919 RepID=A0ABT6I0C4_9ACTN|nr:hypothetical protein [Streptomyces chengmaiensis]MDH2394038.1 hypothetical protein [Streptomyces chengmaiensis]